MGRSRSGNSSKFESVKTVMAKNPVEHSLSFVPSFSKRAGRGAGNAASLIGILLVLFCFQSFSVKAAESLAILPTKISLSGPAARQEILVERFDGSHFTGQLTNELEISSSDPKVLRVEG